MSTPGSIVISIDVPETGGRQSGSVEQLTRIFRNLHIPATWACAKPSEAKFVKRLQESRDEHEFAVLADPSWLGPDVGRTEFARQLSQRVTAATAAGLTIGTLALRNTGITQNLDLLVKHQISVVRSSLDRRESGFVRPHALRFGVWEARQPCAIPSVLGYLRAV